MAPSKIIQVLLQGVRAKSEQPLHYWRSNRRRCHHIQEAPPSDHPQAKWTEQSLEVCTQRINFSLLLTRYMSSLHICIFFLTVFAHKLMPQKGTWKSCPTSSLCSLLPHSPSSFPHPHFSILGEGVFERHRSPFPSITGDESDFRKIPSKKSASKTRTWWFLQCKPLKGQVASPFPTTPRLGPWPKGQRLPPPKMTWEERMLSWPSW